MLVAGWTVNFQRLGTTSEGKTAPWVYSVYEHHGASQGAGWKPSSVLGLVPTATNRDWQTAEALREQEMLLVPVSSLRC